MAREYVESNIRKVYQIVNGSKTYEQKRKDIDEIKTDYIHSYCLETKKPVKLTRSNVIKSFSSIGSRMTRDQLVSYVLDNLILDERDKENFTFIDLNDVCFRENILDEEEDLFQYSKDDLRELINRKHVRNTQYITGKLLFLDRSYLYKSKNNVYNLRNECILEGLVDKNEFGKKPYKGCRYFEKLLEYKHIERELQIYIKIWSIYKGYEKNDDESYNSFLNIPKYPKIFGEYIRYQKEGIVDIYNRGAIRCYQNVVNNILSIVGSRDKYKSTDRDRINYIFLKTKHPDSLKEIRYTGKYDDPRKIKLKVDEILGI